MYSRKIFEGSKCFCRHGMTLDIRLIGYLPSINSPAVFTEIIAYDPTIETEAPHLYVSLQNVCRRIGAIERPPPG